MDIRVNKKAFVYRLILCTKKHTSIKVYYDLIEKYRITILYIEEEMHHIAVLDDVVFTFNAHFSGFFYLCLAAIR